jgi:hypothetical protein
MVHGGSDVASLGVKVRYRYRGQVMLDSRFFIELEVTQDE